MPPKKKVAPPQPADHGPLRLGTPLHQLLAALAARVAARLKREAHRK